MIDVMVFGEGLQDPIRVKCDVTLDLTDGVTQAMIAEVLPQVMRAIWLGHEACSKGKHVTYCVQALNTTKAQGVVFQDDN